MDENKINENNFDENVNESVESAETPDLEATTELGSTPEPEVALEPQPTPEPQVETQQEYSSYSQTAAQEPQNTPQPKTDGKATASMVCGIISVIPCCWGIVTLVLGIIAVVMASAYVNETGDVDNSKAKAGKICGIIGIIGSVIGLIYVFVLLANGGFGNFTISY